VQGLAIIFNKGELEDFDRGALQRNACIVDEPHPSQIICKIKSTDHSISVHSTEDDSPQLQSPILSKITNDPYRYLRWPPREGGLRMFF